MSTRRSFSADEARAIGERLGIDWPGGAVRRRAVPPWGWMSSSSTGCTTSSRTSPMTTRIATGKIALAHLNEFADYYTRLARMEAQAERERRGS